MKKERKAEVVDELRDQFEKAKFAVVTDYRGLTVPVMNELRKQLRSEQVYYRVVKNTLLKRAAADTSYRVLESLFEGTTAIAVSYDDPVAPAKVLNNFSKDHPLFAIKGAAIGSSVLTAEDLKTLAQLPSREVLLSKLLSVMNAVPTNFVQVLSGVPRKLVYALQALKDQKEQAAG